MRNFTLILVLLCTTIIGFAQAISRTVSTFAELATTNPYDLAADNATRPLRVTVETQGYYTPFDGGGALWGFTTNSVNTNAYGGLILSPFFGAWEMLNVGPVNARAFGIHPDQAATNNSVRIAAMTAWVTNQFGGAIYFPRGTYEFSETVVLPRRIQILGGDVEYSPINSSIDSSSVRYLALGGTTWRLADGVNAPLLTVDAVGGPQFPQHINAVIADGSTNTTYFANVGIDGIVFDGNATNNLGANALIYLENVWSVTLRNCGVINNHGYAAYFRNCNSLRVENLQGGSDGGGKGIVFDECSDSHFYGAQYGGQDGPGIFINSGFGWYSLFENNFIFNGKGDPRNLVSGIVSDTITTTTNHTFLNGDIVLFSTVDGTLPAEVEDNICYFAANITANTLQIHTNRVSALNGGFLPVTAGGGDYYVTPGPSVSVYILRGAHNNIIGNRFDQNYSDGVVINYGTNNIVSKNVISNNGWETTNAATAIRLIGGASYNDVSGNEGIDQEYGIWADSSTVGNMYGGSPGLLGTLANVIDTGANKVLAWLETDGEFRANDLNITNSVTARALNIGYELDGLVAQFEGGAGGASQITIARPGVSSATTGLAATTDTFVIKNQSRLLNSFDFFSDESLFRLTFGNTAGRSTTDPAQIRGEPGLGNNVAGGALAIYPGLSTGNATPASLTLGTTTTGSSGSSLQSVTPAVTISGSATTPTTAVSGALTLNGYPVISFINGGALAYSGGTNVTVTVTTSGAPHYGHSLSVTNDLHLSFSGHNSESSGGILLSVSGGPHDFSVASGIYKPAATTLPLSLTDGVWNLEWKQRTLGGTNYTILTVLDYD